MQGNDPTPLPSNVKTKLPIEVQALALKNATVLEFTTDWEHPWMVATETQKHEFPHYMVQCTECE